MLNLYVRRTSGRRRSSLRGELAGGEPTLNICRRDRRSENVLTWRLTVDKESSGFER